MKKVLLPLFAILSLLACNTDSNEIATPSNLPLGSRSTTKVAVCHNGHVINVSSSALPAHLAHGDAIDNDGDGYFSGTNACGMPEDCNDDDASLTDNCCLSGTWCGTVSFFTVHVSFNEDCTADIIYNGVDCANGTVTWALISVEDNVYTYQETDLCGINGCIVTVTASEDSLLVSYDCTTPPSSGTFTRCAE